jgi:DNA-binding NarL/FixJ family response regulator
MKRIVVVEDEIIVAKSIEGILKNNGYSVTGVATSYEKAKLILKTSIPDLILCDINLNYEKTGIDLMEEVNLKYNIPFIFISANNSSDMIKAAVNTRPLNYITKPFNEKQLLVSVASAFELIEKRTEEKYPTDKEIHILQFIAEGYSTKEIAEKLSLSFHTIESHRKNMLQKFQVKNITNLVFLATTKGWIKA